MSHELDTNLPPSEPAFFEQKGNRDECAEIIGTVAVQATRSHVEVADGPPGGLYGYGAAAAAHANAEKDQKQVDAERLEALKILDKDTFKLGDLNPLLHITDLTRKESTDAIRHTILRKIQAVEGTLPEVLESTVVYDPESKDSKLRFIARFEVSRLTEDQLTLLEDLVGTTYGVTVRTRTDNKGNDMRPESYPPIQIGEEMKSKTGGWYMGPNLKPTTSLHEGLFVFKDYGAINKDNFLDDSQTPRKYIVEIRESSQYQTDLVAFVTQVASILGQEKLLDRGQLLYETYYDLIRLGLKGTDTDSIYGMDEAADMIRRELITPLASPDISRGVGEEAQSVLMIGVPGTGKTLVVERLLQEETGLFILPIDPFELQAELMKPKEKQTLMPRISEIAAITGKHVVLHVDDIENMVTADEATNSTMLNLMAGVQESGFHIIASSNYPEKINPSLIQPQRFSVLIHCGLQTKEARYEILKIHAGMNSLRLRNELFDSEEVRDIILRQVAEHTAGFTPRYMANIATIAKSYLIDRVAQAKDKTIGLTEEDLESHTFTVADWEKAFREVSAKYDSNNTTQRDQELSDYVKKHTAHTTGFTPGNAAVTSVLFPPDVMDKVIAAQAKAGHITT